MDTMMEGFDSLDDVDERMEPSQNASSLSKMLQILELFTEDEPVRSTASIIEALETSRATGYRYIKTLHDAGLLNAVRSGRYTLGRRIIQMDLQIRQSDPLLLAGAGVLEDLVDTIGHSALLCAAYDDSVLCVAECRAPLSPANRFSRGEQRPLFQGAISKIILAHLPLTRLKAIYARQPDDVERAGLGSTWNEFRTSVNKFKKDGYALTVGEFNPGVTGIAAPILDQKVVVGSVGVAWDEKERDVNVQRAILAVKLAGMTVSERLAEKQQR